MKPRSHEAGSVSGRTLGVTTFGVISVDLYACQSMMAEGGTTLWIKWWMGVGLPELGIGWEVTCDALSMRILGSQEKEGECSTVLGP